MSRLEGEIAVVTGAAQGIGLAVAQALAAEGARVAATDVDGEGARRAAVGLGAQHLGLELDVRSRASVDEACAAVVARLGEPTILVNNAGINRVIPAETLSEEDWHLVLDVNLTGLFRCCQVFGALMLASRRGVIVNVASISGPELGFPGRAAYGASKAGVVGLTKVLAVEWAGRGVRVNAIAPGPVRTPMVEAAIAEGVLDEAQISARSPSGRLAEPEDVARAVVLLASPDAGFITGQTLVVDGGYAVYGAAGSAPRPVC